MYLVADVSPGRLNDTCSLPRQVSNTSLTSFEKEEHLTLAFINAIPGTQSLIYTLEEMPYSAAV